MGSAFQEEQREGVFQQPELTTRVFREFASLMYEKAGITLGPNKESLVAARVRKRMRQLAIHDFSHYLELVRQDTTGAEMVELLNVISTNVTHFFREKRHFELLAFWLKKWAADGQSRFRIWSAASSSGEEPYSIAMVARDALPRNADLRILATDISTKVLNIAKQGRYPQTAVDKMPERYKKCYFRRDARADKPEWVIDEAIRRCVTFTRLNLSEPPFPMTGPLDIIFCRNVMIYFDNAVRKRLLAECSRLLKPGGFLMVGHAESLSGMLVDLKTVEPSVYTKPA